ncbi:MAG: type I-F CRISPR-associated protein Csy1 [Comamonas sp.]|nr:type I-F CRISPR-associated protein Csy1 [Comamonas sp.]
MKNEQPLSPRGQQIRQHLHQHVQSRLDAVLARYQGRSDTPARTAIQAAQEKYTLASVLSKGAKAAKSIAIASHLAKATHPDLKVKNVSNLAVDFSTLPVLEALGSHALVAGEGAAHQSLLDASGDGAYNNAAYELYLLLDSRFEGQSLAEWLAADDEDAVQAFSLSGDSGADTAAAQPWLDLLGSKCPQVAVSTLSKQVYWLASPAADACNDHAYLLLAPLFPASLTHQAYKQIHADRYSEANNAARKARREGKPHDGIFRDYPGLAVQKMGGTKPQNISQLNSERGGVNYLLASLPPQWRTKGERLPVNTYSVFERFFTNRPPVRRTVQALQRFLQSNPEPNQATRQRRESLVDGLLSELMLMVSELHQLPPGWSADSQRFGNLHRSEQLWLDPLRAEKPSEAEFAEEWLRLEWPAAIAQRFANWLNAQLRGKLPVGDAEAQEWAKVLLSDEDGFQEQLRALHRQLRGLTSNAAEEVTP